MKKLEADLIALDMTERDPLIDESTAGDFRLFPAWIFDYFGQPCCCFSVGSLLFRVIMTISVVLLSFEEFGASLFVLGTLEWDRC